MAEGEAGRPRRDAPLSDRDRRIERRKACSTDADQIPQGAQGPHQRPGDLGWTLRSASSGSKRSSRSASPRARSRPRAAALTRHMKRRGGSGSASIRTCRYRRSRSRCAWVRARARRSSGLPRQAGAHLVRDRRGIRGACARGAYARRRQAAIKRASSSASQSRLRSDHEGG